LLNKLISCFLFVNLYLNFFPIYPLRKTDSLKLSINHHYQRFRRSTTVGISPTFLATPTQESSYLCAIYMPSGIMPHYSLIGI